MVWTRSSPGRPLSGELAWAYLAVLDVALVAKSENDLLVAAVRANDRILDRRLQFRFRQVLASPPSVDRWVWWLQARAKPRRVWMHSAVANRLGEDKRVRVGAEPAAAAAQIGVGGGVGGRGAYYVDQPDVAGLVDELHAKDDPFGPVLLIMLPNNVPQDFRPRSGQPVRPAAALVDLLGSPDSRSHEQAHRLLSDAAHRAATLELK